MHVRLIPHSPSGPRHLLAHYPLVSCILALLAIYTDARAYRPSASLLAFLAGRVWTFEIGDGNGQPHSTIQTLPLSCYTTLSELRTLGVSPLGSCQILDQIAKI